MGTTSLHRILGRLVPALVLFVGICATAQAQGHSNKNTPTAPGKSGKTSPGHGAHGAGNLPVGTRTVGAWLDDASAVDPGSSSLAISWDNWASPVGTQEFFPTASFSIGINKRVQAQASVPYLYGGTLSSTSSIGDLYAGTKVVLAGLSGPVGLAVIPTLEILGSQSVANKQNRVHWVLPASIELRGTRARLYATTGYFSRGAVFVGAAVDGQVNSRVSLVATVTETKPVGANQLLPDGNPATSQLDVGGGVFVSLTDRFAVFGSVGRTLSQLQADSTKRLISLGMAITVSKGRAAVQ